MTRATGEKIRTIIVDDEELARQVLREYLSAHADIEIAAECANGFEAVKAVSELEPDLVFLDIQMPKLDGFEVLELIGNEAAIIFVTAHDEFAIRAFEVHAVDYLLKPVGADRFGAALERAKKRLGGKSPRPGVPTAELIAAARPPAQYADRIPVRDGAMELSSWNQGRQRFAPKPPFSARSSAAPKRCRTYGFADDPPHALECRMANSSCAVTKMVSASLPISSSTSNPSSFGIGLSRNTRSGSNSGTALTASIRSHIPLQSRCPYVPKVFAEHLPRQLFVVQMVARIFAPSCACHAAGPPFPPERDRHAKYASFRFHIDA